MQGLEDIKRANDEQVERERAFARLRKSGRLAKVKPYRSAPPVLDEEDARADRFLRLERRARREERAALVY